MKFFMKIITHFYIYDVEVKSPQLFDNFNPAFRSFNSAHLDTC